MLPESRQSWQIGGVVYQFWGCGLITFCTRALRASLLCPPLPQILDPPLGHAIKVANYQVPATASSVHVLIKEHRLKKHHT